MADSSYQVFSNRDTNQTAKDIKLIDNEDGTFSLTTTVIGSNGEKIGSFGGALNVHDADVHREIVNTIFHFHTSEVALLTIDAPAQSTEITVDTPTASMVVGAYLHIQNGTTENTHPQITAVNGNTFTLDRPLDNNFSIGDSVEVAIINMVQNGSLSSPISFRVMPLAGQVWHLTRILYQMAHESSSDISTFGGIAKEPCSASLVSYLII